VTPGPSATRRAEHDEDGDSLEHRHGISGIVTAISGNATDGTLTIRTEDGVVAKIKVNAQTEIKGQGHDDPSFADIKVGDRVNVQGEPTATAGDATLVANHVIVHGAGHGDDDGAADHGEGHGQGQSQEHGGGHGEGNGRGHDR
jgi:hypothetical protein